MTLPSPSSRPAVDFNNFNVMASIDVDISMQMPTIQQQPVPSSPLQEQLPHQHNNNVNQEITAPPITTSTAITVSTAAATVFSSHDLAVESVMPGIYFTKNFTVWNEENLHAHGFTHIIIIDKHIQELYYPSPIFKLSTLNKNNESYEFSSPFDYFCSAPVPPAASLNFSKEFEAIDLNFGEKSYLTTVLPNCYRAVRFINKALQSGGTILVIDCNGGEQKCLTIIVAYLMYKYNDSFSNAFARLKSFYTKADLDRFYISQLFEYEPILQVQRAQSRGHSCSRELHAAILKRKKNDDDGNLGSDCVLDNSTATNKILQNFNPLSQFDTAMAQQNRTESLQERTNEHGHVAKQQFTGYLNREKADFYSNGDIVNSLSHANYDDYAME